MLSREFLTERGYCCGHGCLMCPYEPKHIKDNTLLKVLNCFKEDNQLIQKKLRSVSVDEGEIIAGKLAIEPGAIFTGKCSMGTIVKDIHKKNEDTSKAQAAQAG